MTTRIALGVEYQGTRFHGWQSQAGYSTVQSEVEQALSQVADQPIEVFCAGRTDAGVHAIGQVIHFDTSVKRAPQAWVLGVNRYLPKDISIKWQMQVNEDFHARFSALKRRYSYIIHNNVSRPALMSDRVTWVTKALDETKMHAAGQALLGEHDFSSFRAAECQAKSPIRMIHELTVYRIGDHVVMEIEANAFLHHMVRNIMGVLLAVGMNHLPIEAMKQILQAKDRRQARMTASPNGLYLTKVYYPVEFGIPQQGDDKVNLCQW